MALDGRGLKSEIPFAMEHQHFRELERLYPAAPINRFYQPTIRIEEGRCEIGLAARSELMHAADAVHGSVYFKLLDDACFFAVNSVVEDVFVLTASFSLDMTRPVRRGGMIASGRLVHSSRRLYLAEGEARDDAGRLIARGSGSFMRSDIQLDPSVGYR